MLDAEGREFTGLWIPAPLWLDESLSRLEIEILADITTFRDYYKSNTMMAKFFKVSPRQIQNVLSEMEEKNLIRKYFTQDNRGLTVRHIEITPSQHAKMYPAPKAVGDEENFIPPRSFLRTPHEENFVPPTKKTSPKNTYKNTYENTYREERGVAEATPQTPPKKSHFQKPTVEEIQAYLDEKDIIGIDAEYFWNFYETKGWLVGKSPMKNWKACIATWVKRNEKGCKNGNDTRNDDETETPYDFSRLYFECLRTPNGDESENE